jgi:hypothetical protein
MLTRGTRFCSTCRVRLPGSRRPGGDLSCLHGFLMAGQRPSGPEPRFGGVFRMFPDPDFGKQASSKTYLRRCCYSY